MHEVEALDTRKMRRAASQASGILRLLANEDRLLLLCQLTQGERCVGELETLLGIHQPTLSQQLSVLRAEHAVTTRRAGKNVYYAIADERIRQVLSLLYRMYCR